MTPEEFRQALEKKGFELSDKQMHQFDLYYQTLIEWNEKMNLTAITERDDVYLKHFYDSLTLAFFNDFSSNNISLCDVGAGAGFPSIPLKILFPNVTVTIVDSLNKRITFLNHLQQKLELTGIHFVHDRAESFGQTKMYRETYDYVTARAVARLNVLVELCLPLVKKQGYFLAMKAAKTDEELNEAKRAISLLGGKLVDEKDVSLPVTNDSRYVLKIKKVKETPNKYPRKPGTPNKQPLV